jgi:guanine deaminase
MSDLRSRLLLADAFHAPQCGRVEMLRRALFAIDAEGVIAAVYRREAPGYAEALAAARVSGVFVEWPERQFLLPGFVDLHVHAPQYPQLGAALDEPLEVWLNKYTYPLEARYADLDFAKVNYSALVDDLLANGTTTALYFATIHQAATRALADICLKRGQRALIGRVAMDNPELCPDYYRDPSAQAAVEETRAFIAYVRGHPDNGERRVTPVVTPRFIPACTDAALAGLGALASECGCPVQTHASESDWEHGYVLARHGVTDAASLDRFGLMGRRTVLAHAVHLTDADMDLIAGRGSGIAHCPASNAYFADAVFPLRRALDKGIHVGLGTDISGGPSSLMFDACRTAALASRLLESGVDPRRPAAERGAGRGVRVDFRVAFHLATAGGGVALDLPIGVFAPGNRFDAIRLDADAPAGGVRLWDLDADEQILQKIVYGASRANIAGVWVDGRAVA